MTSLFHIGIIIFISTVAGSISSVIINRVYRPRRRLDVLEMIYLTSLAFLIAIIVIAILALLFLIIMLFGSALVNILFGA